MNATEVAASVTTPPHDSCRARHALTEAAFRDGPTPLLSTEFSVER